MCIPVRSRRDNSHPIGYKINRGRGDERGDGPHVRRYSSVENLLRRAPPTSESKLKGKGYPHEYENKYKPKLFHAKPQGFYYEYPTMDYPYARQNCRGRNMSRTPGGRSISPDPGHTRTITDADGNIQGLIYHPEMSRTKFLKAEEIYPSFSSRCHKRFSTFSQCLQRKYLRLTKRLTPGPEE